MQPRRHGWDPPAALHVSDALNFAGQFRVRRKGAQTRQKVSVCMHRTFAELCSWHGLAALPGLGTSQSAAFVTCGVRMHANITLMDNGACSW